MGNDKADKFIYTSLRYFKTYVNKRFTKEFDMETLMTWYFTGDNKIKEFLLNPFYKSYEDLYADLFMACDIS